MEIWYNCNYKKHFYNKVFLITYLVLETLQFFLRQKKQSYTKYYEFWTHTSGGWYMTHKNSIVNDWRDRKQPTIGNITLNDIAWIKALYRRFDCWIKHCEVTQYSKAFCRRQARKTLVTAAHLGQRTLTLVHGRLALCYLVRWDNFRSGSSTWGKPAWI